MILWDYDIHGEILFPICPFTNQECKADGWTCPYQAFFNSSYCPCDDKPDISVTDKDFFVEINEDGVWEVVGVWDKNLVLNIKP